MDIANGAVSKMEALERDNASKKDEIQDLRKEIESLRREAEELESEVNAAEEAGSEAAALSSVLEDQERTLVFLERETKTLKQLNAECEMKVRDLERRIGVLEVRKSEEQSKRVRVEEEMREKVGEKEKQIETLKQRIKDLEEGKAVERIGNGERGNEEEKKGLGFMWPLVAAGGAAVVAVFYFCFRKLR
ncbi:hypothetical protein PHAVU_006G033700 [Phaseolus vulgaris]|uniref:Uncharacterized protein n=1 Tax=Phaseolus vulgaris TaxID=3885 RepID=V7BMR7_PHAVU|nr:hypothetical protein PHAVU_006G033700g [Phaseolus vulgaris]ESW18350.1 hypothetical protein PHAVU_006G033700g [Phaseolus vulgaris]